MDFYIKQGDTLPIFAVQLLDDNGTPIDLTSCTVQLWVEGMGDNPKTMTVYDNAVVTYQFSKEETKNFGTYVAEIRIIYNNGDIITLPTIGSIKIHVYYTVSEVIQ